MEHNRVNGVFPGTLSHGEIYMYKDDWGSSHKRSTTDQFLCIHQIRKKICKVKEIVSSVILSKWFIQLIQMSEIYDITKAHVTHILHINFVDFTSFLILKT
jgi:hypothetical protein